MKFSFQRLTSTGYYIPAVDGLRFVAITSVVFYHLMVFFKGKSLAFSSEQFNNTLLVQVFERGYVGVPLFFVISGFILGLPFAKHYLLNDKPISLRTYFVRRITRLEVPYLVALTLLLVGAVYFAKVMTLQDGIKSYIASVFYVHNIVFQNFPPKISAVTWSLEVEVQFYILAPLLACIFIIHGQILRRLTFVILAALSIMINAFQLSPFSFNTLIDYFHYFIIGLLLADVYVSKSVLVAKTCFDDFIGVLLVAIIWLFDESYFQSNTQIFFWRLIEVCSIFLLYYYVLMHQIFRFLSLKIISTIGGMCYSIYLLHYAVISMIGNWLLKYSFSTNVALNFLIYTSIILIAILAVSSIFYLCIERPCMRKDWHKRLFGQLNMSINASIK